MFLIKWLLFSCFLFCMIACQQKRDERRHLLDTKFNEIEFLIQCQERQRAKQQIAQVLSSLKMDSLDLRNSAVFHPDVDVDRYLIHSRLALYSIQIQNANWYKNEEIDEILQWQEGLNTLLTSCHSLTLAQQITINRLLASLYCLIPQTIHRADSALDQAINLMEEQLKDLFEQRNTFDPRVLPIHELKKNIRTLKLFRAEVNIHLQQWQRALQCLETYFGTLEASELARRIKHLEDRKEQIAPIIQSHPMQGEQAATYQILYQMEWRRVQMELNELKKVVHYKALCLKMLE